MIIGSARKRLSGTIRFRKEASCRNFSNSRFHFFTYSAIRIGVIIDYISVRFGYISITIHRFITIIRYFNDAQGAGALVRARSKAIGACTVVISVVPTARNAIWVPSRGSFNKGVVVATYSLPLTALWAVTCCVCLAFHIQLK